MRGCNICNVPQRRSPDVLLRLQHWDDWRTHQLKLTQASPAAHKHGTTRIDLYITDKLRNCVVLQLQLSLLLLLEALLQAWCRCWLWKQTRT
jgi:hypothetical protein